MANKRKDLEIKGSNLWYLVGLITSDGCLSKDNRHIDITSKNYEFFLNLKEVLGLNNKIGVKNKDKINRTYHLQFSNRNFYEFLLSIGLMPTKSLNLKELKIPKEFFADFLRGLIDGDGSLRRWLHPTNLHEQWSLRIYSGSELFTKWLKTKIEQYFDCQGRIYSTLRSNRQNFIYTLKYGKIGAKAILEKCYYSGSFGLAKKVALANSCLSALSGWHSSKI